MSKSGVYKIETRLGTYFGASQHIGRRIDYHRTMLRHGKHWIKRIQTAHDLWGMDAVKITVLAELPKGKALELEKQLIASFPASNVNTYKNSAVKRKCRNAKRRTNK